LTSNNSCSSAWIVSLFIRLTVVVVILTAQFNVVLIHSARADALQTLGDFLSLGANTARELQDAIQLAGNETRQTLQQLKDEIDAIIQTLSQTYKSNLGITIDSLDKATSNKLLELEDLINSVNNVLQQDIYLVKQSSIDVINHASLEIKRVSSDLEQRLKNVIIIGGETAVYVVDRTTNDIIFIVSVVMLGIGLLLFIWLFFMRKMPSGLARSLVFVFIIIYLVAFGSMAFVPVARAEAMVYSGLGMYDRLPKGQNLPHAFDAVPREVTLGQIKELSIWGSNLYQKNKTLTVTIADIEVPVKAVADQTVVVNIESLKASDGSTNVILFYNGTEETRWLVKIGNPPPPVEKPDLTITKLTFDPVSPLLGNNVNTTITVYNQGKGPAGPFAVIWKPYSGHPGLTAYVQEGMAAGEIKSFSFYFSVYPNSGTFETVATVDYLHRVDETEETNNDFIKSITIFPSSGPPSPTTPKPTTPKPSPQPTCRPDYKCCKYNADGGCILCYPQEKKCPSEP
jgi:hypothetical protein